MKTTAPDNPGYRTDEKAWFRELRRYCGRTEFAGLNILSVEMGSHPDEGFVTFRAILNEKGRDRSFTERSRFLRQNGTWFKTHKSVRDVNPCLL